MMAMEMVMVSVMVMVMAMAIIKLAKATEVLPNAPFKQADATRPSALKK